MGRAEEWLRRAPARRLSPAGGTRGRRGALATLRGLSALREFLPTVVQVGIQNASWRQSPQDLPRARDALCKAPRLRGRHRRDEGSFESAWPCVRAWLEAEPDRVGKELFARLQCELPGVFPDGQLRTFQRRVREWRRAAAQQLVFASSAKDAA